MSRIGKHSINIPQGVNVSVDANNVVTVTGPKGTLSRDVHKDIKVVVENNEVRVLNESNNAELSKFHGLARQLISNMVIGVSQGFERRLTINGVGYRITQKGQDLVLNVGYSHPVELKAIDGITLSCDKNEVIVQGIDKEKVGQFASKVRDIRRVEPYHAYGIYYSNEVVRRKERKTGKK
jgi:large subunit ribosomal protein L6